MKHLTLLQSLSFVVLVTTNINPQITTTKVVGKIETKSNLPYDSTANFLGKDVFKYIGQELYLKGKAEGLRKYGYAGFTLEYTKGTVGNDKNVYKCCESYNSKYNELAGKYFKVLDVIKHPKAAENEYLYGKKFYLKLHEKSSSDVVYYEYDSQFEHSFPFVAVGYFTKLKNDAIKKEFVVRGKNWINNEPMTDIKTGNPVSGFEPGNKWKCVDLTIEEVYFTLAFVLENDKGEQIPLNVDQSDNTNWVFDSEKAEIYRKIFGDENWQRILTGKVKIGMTKEMCELSWGKPKKINETITSSSKNEQWVYSENYLYFDNGILTTIQ